MFLFPPCSCQQCSTVFVLQTYFGETVIFATPMKLPCRLLVRPLAVPLCCKKKMLPWQKSAWNLRQLRNIRVFYSHKFRVFHVKGLHFFMNRQRVKLKCVQHTMKNTFGKKEVRLLETTHNTRKISNYVTVVAHF